MTKAVIQTKPSFLEGGLPCASLSAECQRDNNARIRPPQNRLHIWWARRPPTICRAAILSAILPVDMDLKEDVLPIPSTELTEEDIQNLPPKFEEHLDFFKNLLNETSNIPLNKIHENFLRSLGITSDINAAVSRIAAAAEYHVGNKPIQMPAEWGYRHIPAFRNTPSKALVETILSLSRELFGLNDKEDIVVLDSMAGGGVIPLEAVRYGYRVYANDLNPVAAIAMKATIQYPAQFGILLADNLDKYCDMIADKIESRLDGFTYNQQGEEWWPDTEREAERKFNARAIVKWEAGGSENIQATLWVRQVPCPKCNLNIPISTNFHIVTKKGKPEAAIAAFPEVPPIGKGNDCTFRIVKKSEWKDCRWPKPGFEKWHPRDTPTFKDGDALCPRCDNVVDGDEVKEIARSRKGGLPAQMYAVASKVPVKVTYQNGDEKIRYMWRFRAPSDEDLQAVEKAEAELNRLLPKWESQGLVPDEEIPEGEKTKEPLNVGFNHWRDLFLPRQLLTNLVVLEEIRNAQQQAKSELPADEAEAVSVYLAFILSKVVNYNSVNTFWHYGRQTVTQTFSRHDFAFRPAFCEFEGARETVMWGAAQVKDAYEALCGLIHGYEVEDHDSDDEAEDDEETDLDDANDVEKENDAGSFNLRPEVIVPTVTCEDAAALSIPEPGTVHLICVDPPYYNNVQYAELSNFFYVWLKRALKDIPGLAHLFNEPLAETNREAVANKARWKKEAEQEIAAWQARYDEVFEALRADKVKVAEAKQRALEEVGPKPLTAKERADQFYESKMAQVFRRARQLLHPAGRMVVMFNHKQTWAWRSLGMALIRAGFEIRSSVPVHTEAESSLNIRGLDAARSTVLLLCTPREEKEQVTGNWAGVQTKISRIAQNAAKRFQDQGLEGTDLYLSSLGPALGEVARNWPVTDFSGREVDLADALEEAYRSVGQWRLTQVFNELSKNAELKDAATDFSAQSVDRDTQTLWLWLDTFKGEVASSDDVQKLAKSLNVDPNEMKRMGLLSTSKDTYVLRAPEEIDLRGLSRRLSGDTAVRGRDARQADIWEERSFPNFVGAAIWNAIALMSGSDGGPGGADAVKQWLRNSGYESQKEFFAAYAVTLHLLDKAFKTRKEGDTWKETARHARRAWDLVISSHRI